ncbi:hypothetical protein L227DRAFT_573476 [Lentinus tigrinus ALCF2SS1-6]|uniref:Uncharacterized protein n=1 Tax=Lentinus tigrinus ALCF2SS1-6 TaxID=1328759 RepID=A0A5C2SG82_9APHY|nr:hypothetical protein L227DRAFT_573476 [Lentinus tigrinus ALCF2SS1-6]
MRPTLDRPSNNITGLKPRGMERNVFLRPIPKSPYSIRLFPGRLESREYCLDFVHGALHCAWQHTANMWSNHAFSREVVF